MSQVLSLSSSSMAEPWLLKWLETDFYGKKCSIHVHKYLTVCCIVCMCDPICTLCWQKESKHHDHGHQVLQVCTSSRRVAILVDDIKCVVDVSNIQPYLNNNKNVVFLKPPKPGMDSDQSIISELDENHPTCQLCKRKLKDSGYEFCSIACKANSTETRTRKLRLNQHNIECVELTKPSEINYEIEKDCKSSQSMDKRRRKGKPMRSPLM